MPGFARHAWSILDSTKITRLPLRCEPIHGESLNGFITRLAERNLLDRAAWVADAAGVRLPQTWYSAADVERLAVVSGLEAEALNAMAPGPLHSKGSATVSAVLGHDVPTEAIVRHVRRVCPQCLAEAPHHRVIWDMRFVRSCVEHGVRLLAACPACGKMLDWRTPSVSGCGCQAAPDLSTVRTAPVHEEQLAGTRFLQAMLLGVEQPVPEFLVSLELNEVFSLLSKFGYLQDGGFRS